MPKKGQYQQDDDMNLVKENVDNNPRTCNQERNTHPLQFVTMSCTKIQ